MKTIALALVSLAACGGKAQPKPGAGSGSGMALYAKKLSVGWGIRPNGAQNDLFLQTTDETGKQTSYPLGTYPPNCQVTKPAPEMKAVTAIACSQGWELDAVVSGDQVVVLKGQTTGGAAPDPMAREEITRVSAPGAAIEAATP